jgi:hypothetical protein
MSLAMFAAPFDDNANLTLPINSDSSDNILNQKRHKKTQRKYPKIENFDTNRFDPNKVSSVLKEIHNTTEEDDDEKDVFNPPPKPESMGVMKTTPPKEGFISPLGRTVGNAPTPNDSNGDNLDLNDYSNYGDSKSIEEYYKSVLPGYNPQKNYVNTPYYPYKEQQNTDINRSSDINHSSQDVLMQKLNYVISLLENQQDEKTNHVTEEVILYSFLGIFIIFIADTFVVAGKYTR